tara:strand:+ start:1089 stop:1637 length:549 start_codon:yes stop_codon:yes gene_type:complete
MSKSLKVIFLGFLIVACIIIQQYYSNNINESDIKELEIISDKIVWNEKTKLKWTDFKYDPNEKSFTVYTKVGLAARYNVYPPILFRSHTTFSPKESIVSDTTNIDDLRIAQAKFDLLETYRRKMEKEVDSLKQLENRTFKKSDFENLTERFYQSFEIEWESYRPITYKSLYRVEKIVTERLK